METMNEPGRPAFRRLHMSWFILLFAGVFEVVWAIGLKFSAETQRPWAIALTVVATIVSMVLLSISMRQIPLGTAYAVWTGVGAVGAFIAGVIFLRNLLISRALCVFC